MSMERGAREIEPVFRDRWVISKTLTALRVNLNQSSLRPPHFPLNSVTRRELPSFHFLLRSLRCDKTAWQARTLEGVRAYYRHGLVRLRATDNGPLTRKSGGEGSKLRNGNEKSNGSCLYSCRACGPVQCRIGVKSKFFNNCEARPSQGSDAFRQLACDFTLRLPGRPSVRVA